MDGARAPGLNPEPKATTQHLKPACLADPAPRGCFASTTHHPNDLQPLSAVSEHSMLTGAAVQHEQRLIVPVSIIEVILALDPEYECCKSHGAVLAMDVNTGDRLWVRELTNPAVPQALSKVGAQNYGPSGVPVWSTPTVDARRGLIYVGTDQNASLPATEYSDAVIALDLETGEVVWHFQAIAGMLTTPPANRHQWDPTVPSGKAPTMTSVRL